MICKVKCTPDDIFATIDDDCLAETPHYAIQMVRSRFRIIEYLNYAREGLGLPAYDDAQASNLCDLPAGEKLHSPTTYDKFRVSLLVSLNEAIAGEGLGFKLAATRMGDYSWVLHALYQ